LTPTFIIGTFARHPNARSRTAGVNNVIVWQAEAGAADQLLTFTRNQSISI
jgi:hypothetical protein